MHSVSEEYELFWLRHSAVTELRVDVSDEMDEDDKVGLNVVVQLPRSLEVLFSLLTC